MSASTTSNPFPLASEHPTEDGPPGYSDPNEYGAAGSRQGDVSLSRGAFIAIIIVVVVVSVIGIGSAVLFYVAKKREWKIRETLRRSARSVVKALTPRRAEFPRHLKDDSRPSSRQSGMGGGRKQSRLREEVPPTPRLPVDLEKGLGAGRTGKASKDTPE